MADRDFNVTYYSINTDVISDVEWALSLLAKGLRMQASYFTLRIFQPLPADRLGRVVSKAVALLDKSAVEPLRAEVEAFSRTK